MSATTSPSAKKAYSVARILKVWGIARSTYYDWKKRMQKDAPKPRKPGPAPTLSDALVQYKGPPQSGPKKNTGHVEMRVARASTP
jgi:hypothetical protein